MSQEHSLTRTPPVRGANGNSRSTAAIGSAIPPVGTANGADEWWADNGRSLDQVAIARFGMILVIVVETMTFAGLISVFLSIKASLPIWPPPDQFRYPIEATAINTAILLASGLTLFIFRRWYQREDTTAPKLTALLVVTAVLGAIFVGLQGFEWVRLIGYGLTMTSSSYGSIFYVIIGFHALHVVSGVLCLGVVTWLAVSRKFPRKMASLEVVAMFWFFVVLVWPILYAVVYF